MAILAKGANYFGADGFPVTALRVKTESGGRPSHAHDITEIDHYHDFCELVLVLGGRGRHHLANESFPVSAGNVFVVQGSQVHCFREREDLLLVNVMYAPDRLQLPEGLLRLLPGYSALFMLEPSFRSAHRFSSRLQLGRDELGAAEALAERIEAEAAARKPGHEAVLLGLLIELMAFLSRHYGESNNSESRALLRMGRLISTLEQRFGEAWTLESMAEIARLSRTNLLRNFRQATGRSPVEFLIGLRLAAAKRLLRQSELGMTEIALAVGFGDSNYFARKFRESLGQTPTEYRRRSRL